MVLIIPTSGCLNIDLNNIARQMINIEQNTKLFSDKLGAAECKCIDNPQPDKKHTQQNTQQKNVSFPYLEGNKEKFNVYTLKNPIDPEHPITVETASDVGTIVLYLNNPEVAQDLKRNISKLLSMKCNRIIYQLTSANPDIETNGVKYIEEPLYTSSRYTLAYTPIELDAPREIYYSDVEKRPKLSTTDSFVWTVYIVFADSFSVHDFMEFSANQIRYDRDCRNKIGLYKHAKETYRIMKIGEEDRRRIIMDKLNHIENSVLDNIVCSDYELSSQIYAPNMILLDGADLFKTDVVLKQLELPKIDQINYPRFINIDIHIRSEFGYDQHIAEQYHADNGVDPLFDLGCVMVSIYMSELKNNIAATLSKTSWYPNCGISEMDTYTVGDITYGDISKLTKPDKTKFMSSRMVYFLHAAGTKHPDVNEVLSGHLADVASMFKKKKNTSIFLNKPDNKCFITGLPLWDYYYEYQFLWEVRTQKVSRIVLICMQVSKLGMIYIMNGSRRAHLYINESKFGPLHNLEGDASEFFKILFKANKANIAHVNLIIKKIDATRMDVIAGFKQPLVKKLFMAIDKFGSVYENHMLYVANPETNELFLGIHEEDITDNLILHMKKNSDAYIFIIS